MRSSFEACLGRKNKDLYVSFMRELRQDPPLSMSQTASAVRGTTATHAPAVQAAQQQQQTFHHPLPASAAVRAAQHASKIESHMSRQDDVSDQSSYSDYSDRESDRERINEPLQEECAMQQQAQTANIGAEMDGDHSEDEPIAHQQQQQQQHHYAREEREERTPRQYRQDAEERRASTAPPQQRAQHIASEVRDDRRLNQLAAVHGLVLTTKRVCFEVNVSLAELQAHPGHAMFGLNERSARTFREVSIGAAGQQQEAGVTSGAQVCKVDLVSYSNDLDNDVSIDSPQLPNGTPHNVISAQSGRSFAVVMQGNNSENYACNARKCEKKHANGACCGQRLYRNRDLLPLEMYKRWGPVSPGELRTGVTVLDANTSLLDLKANRHLKKLLHHNRRVLLEDYNWDYHTLAVQERMLSGQVQIPTRVVEKIEAVALGTMADVQAKTIDLAALRFRLLNVHSANGDFSETREDLLKAGKDPAEIDARMHRNATVKIQLAITVMLPSVAQ